MSEEPGRRRPDRSNRFRSVTRQEPPITTINGPTIQVRSGHYVDLLNPDPATVRAIDIAHALSHLCRYTGHCRSFYSVAQHCCLCHDNVAEEFQWDALMHDAAEAYIGDCSRPLKQLLPDYRRIETRIEAAVAETLGLEWPDPWPEVKLADRQALATERRDLMPRTPEHWELLNGIEPWFERITPWAPEQAFREFIARVQRHRPHLLSADGQISGCASAVA